MGLYLSLHAVDADVLEKMLARPELCLEALAPDEVDRLELGLTDSPDKWLSLDKGWHGVHYLLTGTDWGGEEPLCYLVKDGVELEWEDSFYESPPRALRPDQVQAWNDALKALDDTELRSRFNPAAMTAADIYPSIWDRDPKEDDMLGWLMEFVPLLRAFLQRSSSQGQGLLISIS